MDGLKGTAECTSEDESGGKLVEPSSEIQVQDGNSTAVQVERG
jgi:hypothetical protein